MSPYRAMYGEKKDIQTAGHTYKERIGMSPYQAMYGEKKDVSDVRAFGCRAWVYLEFSKYEFPFWNRKMIDQFLSDNSTDILYQHASDVKSEPYNKLHVANYERFHYDTKSDAVRVVLKIMSKENTFTRAIFGRWLTDKVALGKVINMEVKTPLYAFNAGVMHHSLKGLDPRINPDKQPRNFGDAMKALDKQAWAAAYNLEYLGFKQREVFKLVKPAPGVRIHDTLTRLEYKEDNSEFLKCKERLCARGD